LYRDITKNCTTFSLQLSKIANWRLLFGFFCLGFWGGIRLLLGDKRKGEKEKRKGRRKKEKGNSEFHLMACYPLNII